LKLDEGEATSSTTLFGTSGGVSICESSSQMVYLLTVKAGGIVFSGVNNRRAGGGGGNSCPVGPGRPARAGNQADHDRGGACQAGRIHGPDREPELRIDPGGCFSGRESFAKRMWGWALDGNCAFLIHRDGAFALDRARRGARHLPRLGGRSTP